MKAIVIAIAEKNSAGISLSSESYARCLSAIFGPNDEHLTNDVTIMNESKFRERFSDRWLWRITADRWVKWGRKSSEKGNAVEFESKQFLVAQQKRWSRKINNSSFSRSFNPVRSKTADADYFQLVRFKVQDGLKQCKNALGGAWR